MFPLRSFILSLSLAPFSAFAFPGHRYSSAKALYLETNEFSGNSIIALPIKPDGTLADGTLTPAGGVGGATTNPMTGLPAAPDPLVSQNRVYVVGEYLFAVNVGSNTVAMFSIDCDDATKLTLLGTAPVPGTFVNTVTASLKHGLVCAAMSGHQNGISCAPFSKGSLGKFDALRPLGRNTTTPPMGGGSTFSQVQFTEDENFLLATVKADPAVNAPGQFLAYTVSRHTGLSRTDVRSAPNGTSVLFGFDQVPGTNRIVASDPSIGAALLQFNPHDCTVAVIKLLPVAGQKASCWTAPSLTTQSVFLMDGGVDRLVEVNPKDGTLARSIDLSANGDPGLLDARVSGRYLYALSSGSGKGPTPNIVVVDVVTGKQVQQFPLAKYNAGSQASGLYLYT